MKARPRSVERAVAEYLSFIYKEHGYSPVKRIPILGRAGPDIEVNEAGLVIDVKSRISVPQSHIIPAGCMGRYGDYIGVRLEEIGRDTFYSRDIRPSLIVTDWLNHMEEWTRKYMPNGISVIILHRPKTRIANTTFVVKTEDWRRVCQRIMRTE